MTDEERRQHILEHLLREEGQPEVYWWLSFADGTKPKGSQFLGVAIVRASGPATAIRNAHQLGINPGGEVKFGPSPYPGEPPENWCGRLVSDVEEVKRLEKIWSEQ